MPHSADQNGACDGASGDPCDGASATAVVSLLGGAAFVGALEWIEGRRWRRARAAVVAFYENTARVARRTWIDVADDYLSVLARAANAGSGDRRAATLDPAPDRPAVG